MSDTGDQSNPIDQNGQAAAANENPSESSTVQPETVAAEVKKVQPDTNNKVEANKGDNTPLLDVNKMDILNELMVSLTIEVGRAQIKIRDLLSLTKGSIIELNKLAGEPVDIYANGKLISTGNIITANGKYCVRLTSVSEQNKVGIESNAK